VNYDANVNTTVNKLRQALGDSTDKPLYIETIPGEGYCFLLQPEVSDESPHSHFAPASHPLLPLKILLEARAAWLFQVGCLDCVG